MKTFQKILLLIVTASLLTGCIFRVKPKPVRIKPHNNVKPVVKLSKPVKDFVWVSRH